MRDSFEERTASIRYRMIEHLLAPIGREQAPILPLDKSLAQLLKPIPTKECMNAEALF